MRIGETSNEFELSHPLWQTVKHRRRIRTDGASHPISALASGRESHLAMDPHASGSMRAFVKAGEESDEEDWSEVENECHGDFPTTPSSTPRYYMK